MIRSGGREELRAGDGAADQAPRSAPAAGDTDPTRPSSTRCAIADGRRPAAGVTAATGESCGRGTQSDTVAHLRQRMRSPGVEPEVGILRPVAFPQVGQAKELVMLTITLTMRCWIPNTRPGRGDQQTRRNRVSLTQI